MNKNNVIRKGLIIAIIVLFVGASVIPLTGSKSVEKTPVSKSDDTAYMGNFNEPTIVSISPSSQTVGTGESFTVSVYVEPSGPVIGVLFRCLYFDPNLIQANSVTKGTFFGGNEIMFSGGTIDNVAGTISDGYALVLIPDAVNTSGSVFVIEFTAQQINGTSVLDLEGVTIKGDFPPIPPVVCDGSVTVGTERYFDLTIGVIGNGTTYPLPGTYTYLEGTVVGLEAIPDVGWSFDHWDGDVGDPSSAVTNITMDDDEDVTATFTDTTPPITTCILDPSEPDGDNGWYVSCVTVTLNVMDEGSGVESTWYRLDVGYWKLYTGPFEVCEDGYHTVEYYSIDKAGNNEDPRSVDFKIDKTSPVTEHELEGFIGEDGWFLTNVTVTLSATDATSGVNYTKYKLDDGDWIPYEEFFIVTEDGEYNLSYYSVDLAGNTEPTNEVEFKIEKDTTPPETMHGSEGIMGDNGWYTSNVVVTLTAEDDSSGVDYTMYKLDDDDWIKKEYQGPFTFLVTEDGEHTIEYYSVDNAGNEEDDKGPFDFKIDKTLPTIDLTWDEENLKLIADVYDETSGVAKVEFYVNGDPVGTVTTAPYEWEVTNPKRGDKAQAIVYDNAGNDAVSKEVTVQSNSQSQSSSVTPIQRSMINMQRR